MSVCKKRRTTTINASGNTFKECIGAQGYKIIDPNDTEAAVSELTTLTYNNTFTTTITGIFSTPQSYTMQFSRIGPMVFAHFGYFSATADVSFLPLFTDPLPAQFRPRPVGGLNTLTAFMAVDRAGGLGNGTVAGFVVMPNGEALIGGEFGSIWNSGEVFTIYPQTLVYTAE